MEISKTYDFRQLEPFNKRGTKFLILNADDMGMSTGVTDGIVRSYEEGLVTDISMIQTMPDSARAARIALQKGLNVGVHIDLTRQRKVGRPLMGDEVPSLTDDDGIFFASGEFRERMLSGRIDLGEVEVEVRRQVDQALEWGLDLTHIDSNEGMHNYYPEILRMVIKIARQHDLPIRWPNPIHLDWLREEGILTTDHLNYTFYDVPAEAKKRTFLRLLDGFQPGITEFIFHPASPDEDTRKLTVWERREAEMNLLMDREIAFELKERGIQPISFREIRERQRDMRRRGVGRLKAGSAKVRITPPFPTQMGGYFDRKDLSRGTHDDLHVRALSLSDGRKTILIISVEILYVDAKLVGEVREEVSKATGIGEECIMVFATHTHSGPEGHTELASLLGFFPNPALRKFLVERICCCALMAVNGAQGGRIGSTLVEVSDMSTNRQREGGPIDQDLGVIRVEDASGHVIGALVNFTAHPVIMDSKNLLLSSEYPGHAMSVMEMALGKEAVCLFANGACGNVTIRRSGPRFSEVERVGSMLAGNALVAFGNVETTEEVRIGASCSSVPLNLRKLPTVKEAKQQLEELRAREPGSPEEAKMLKKKLAKLAGTAALAQKADYIRAFIGEEITTHLQVFSINDNVLVGVPAELFVEYALTLKKELKPEKTFLIGYCNDIVGYVVTPQAAEEGGYEAGATFLDTEAGDRILNGARCMAPSRS